MICLFAALSKAGVFPSSFKRLLNYELQCILFGLSLGAHSLGSNGPFYNSFFVCGNPKRLKPSKNTGKGFKTKSPHTVTLVHHTEAFPRHEIALGPT